MTSERGHDQPLRVVVMGVAGSGKTAVGRRVADALSARFLDADAAHPAANIAKMSAGVPLTDDDRAPWLDRLRVALAESDRIVVTCSALKQRYRDVLRRAGGVRFVFLAVDRATVLDRVARRSEHFMRVGMVASQFDELEPPGDDEPDVAVVDADQALAAVVEAAVAAARSGP